MRRRRKELLAVGIFGASTLGDRVEVLLRRGREFSPRASLGRVAFSAAALLAFVGIAARAPRWIAFAQQEPKLSFEVASVKPSKGDGYGFGFGKGGATQQNATLKSMVASAYRLQEFQIYGGPGWIGSDRFNVEGKAADRNADPDQLRLMLQSLLADRFKLKLHSETKPSSVYALVVGKNGPKIKLSADQISPTVDGPSRPGAGPNHGALKFGPGSIIGNAVALPLFTRYLSQRLDRLVLDHTNLTGRFDLQLQWTPDVGENPFYPGGDVIPPADPARPSIFAAIQEQLGLKLESTRVPVEVLVIDYAQKPDGN